MAGKLIFFDIDGTIIRPDGTIPPSAVRAVRAARQNGHLCFVNSGRPYSHILPQVKRIGFDGYVCSCGQRIIMNGAVVSSCSPLPAPAAEKIVALVREAGADVVFEAEAGIWFDHTRPMRQEVRETFEDFTARGFDTGASIDRPDFTFDKFCVWIKDGRKKDALLGACSCWFSPIERGSDLVEMVRNSYSKKTGIKYVLQKTETLPENGYAFGDSTNDISMFECVLNSVAMGNAPDNVKKAARYTTAELDEDGLEKGLAMLGLI